MIVDRSGTNWNPWKTGLGALGPRAQVVAGVTSIFGAAAILYKFQYDRRNIPRTINQEWFDATKELNMAKPREAAGPVMVNPIRRYREEHK